jgi:hypothetical protein
MAARAADAGSYWQNYMGFRSELEGERASSVAAIERKMRMGVLAKAQGAAAIEAVDADTETRLGELKKGPTYQLLQEEYTAQRDFAQSQWEANRPAPIKKPRGEGYWTEAGTDDATTDPEWISTSDEPPVVPGEGLGYWTEAGTDDATTEPEWVAQQEVPYEPFAFAGSAEEYFGGLFEEQATDTGARTSDSDILRRKRGGAARSEAVGVGQVYNWY